MLSGYPHGHRRILWYLNQIKSEHVKTFFNFAFRARHVISGYSLTFNVESERSLLAIPTSWKIQARVGNTGDKNGGEDSTDWVTIDERTQKELKWKMGDFDYIGTNGKPNERPEQAHRTFNFLVGHRFNEGFPAATADKWERSPPPLKSVKSTRVEASEYRIILGSSLGSDTLSTIPSNQTWETVAQIDAMEFFESRTEKVGGIDYTTLPKLSEGVGLFLENVDNDVEKSVPKPERLHDRLEKYAKEKSDLLVAGQRENIDLLLKELDAGNAHGGSEGEGDEGGANMQAHVPGRRNDEGAGARAGVAGGAGGGRGAAAGHGVCSRCHEHALLEN